MYPKGHIGISLLVSLPVFLYVDSTLHVLIVALIVSCFSLLPDIDILDIYPINKTDHRGFTHTVWFGILVSSFTFIVVLPIQLTTNLPTYFIPVSATIGIISHLCADVINRSGVQPFRIGSYGRNISINYFLVKSDDSMYNNTLLALGAITTIIFVVITM